MKRVIIFISLAVILAAAGGAFFWRQASAAGTDKPIITVPEDEPEGEPVDIYAAFTQDQLKEVKKRVLKNMARVSKGGEPVKEAEMREIVNYLVALAASRFDVRVDNVIVEENVESRINAQAVCYKDYDAENETAFEIFFIDKAAYEKAKTDAAAMIRLMYVVIHETCHGYEPAAAHDPLSLNGLVFNLWYDAKLVIPEYMNSESGSLIHEMLTDVFACEILLNEIIPGLDMDSYQIESSMGLTAEQMYSSQLSDRGQRLLMAVLRGMPEVFNTAAYNDSDMVTPVTTAYASGQIEPNEALKPLFSEGVPTFAEFIQYMDDTYGIGQINGNLKEDTVNGYSAEDLKRFTLCAPFIMGIADVPYGSYETYLLDLKAQYRDLKVIKDIERIWTPEWAAEMSNKEFAEMLNISGYYE